MDRGKCVEVEGIEFWVGRGIISRLVGGAVWRKDLSVRLRGLVGIKWISKLIDKIESNKSERPRMLQIYFRVRHLTPSVF